MADTKAPEPTKSVAEELREKAEARLTAIREQVGPMITEEHELVGMVGQKAEFGNHVEPVAEPTPSPAPARSESESEAPAPASTSTRAPRKGSRADQAVEFLKNNPNSTPGDVAKAMNIKPNYLYRVLGDLEKSGYVSKDSDGKYSAVS